MDEQLAVGSDLAQQEDGDKDHGVGRDHHQPVGVAGPDVDVGGPVFGPNGVNGRLDGFGFKSGFSRNHGRLGLRLLQGCWRFDL